MKFYFAIAILALTLNACSNSKKVVKNNAEPKKEKHEILVIKSDSLSDKNILFHFVNAPLLSDVLAMAKEQHKWIYIDVGANWCVPCQLMKRDVYTHKATADYFNEHFITYLVDGESNEGPDLRIIFDIKSYPTLMFVDEKGRAMLKIESGISASALRQFGESAVEKKLNEK